MEKQAAFEKIAQVRAKLMLRGAYEAGVRDGMAKEGARGDYIMKMLNSVTRAHDTDINVHRALNNDRFDVGVSHRLFAGKGGQLSPYQQFVRQTNRSAISRGLGKKAPTFGMETPINNRLFGLPAALRKGSDTRMPENMRSIIPEFLHLRKNPAVSRVVKNRSVLANALMTMRKAKMGK